MKNILILFISISIFANDQIPSKKQLLPIAIKNGKIFTITNGIIENGTILFENGKISAIGKEIQIPKNAEIIDANGGFVYPSLINSISTAGLIEIRSVRATRDLTETGEFNPNARGEIALNPDSELLPTIRANGILITNVIPQGNVMPGKSSAIMLDGWTQEDLILQSETGIILEWPNMKTSNSPWVRKSEDEQKKEIEKKLNDIKNFFSEARSYNLAKEKNKNIKTDLKFEAMKNVFNGKTQLIVFASDILQIESALEFCESEKIKFILAGARDAWQISEKLKAKNISVLLGQIYDLPSREWESYDLVYSIPAKLFSSGIKFAITSENETMAERNLPYNAASSTAYGLSKDDALKSITINPAEILGIAKKVGSLEVGKDATLFISSGDILEIPSEVKMAFIQGRKVDLSSHHTELYNKYNEKYRQLEIIK